jgi:GTP-binding protein HflX
MLLTDTVGFIRKLPHGLVDAFRSTLEETTRADLLIHLADASSPEVIPHLKTTEVVLNEIGATAPRLLVFNKIDLFEAAQSNTPENVLPMTLPMLKSTYPDAVFISARTGVGLDTLGDRLKDFLRSQLQELSVLLPFAREDLVALLHRNGFVDHKEYRDSGIFLKGKVPKRLLSSFEPYKIPGGVI